LQTPKRAIIFLNIFLLTKTNQAMNTEFLNDINWLAVLCGGIAFFILGAIWYSKLLFVNKWLGYLKIDPKAADASKGMGAIMTMAFILALIISLALAILRSKLEITGWMSGIKLGALTGFCFGAAAISVSYLFEKRPLGLHLINGGYTVVGNILAAVIICCWS
jgi:hypothetical protein